MKTLPSLLLFLNVLAFPLFSQDVKIGVKAGLGLSEWDIEDASYNSGFFKGFHIGPSLYLKASDRISFESSLILSQKGTKREKTIDVAFEQETFFSNTNEIFSLTYLEMPVVVRYKIISGFNIYAGPQFSYLLKEKMEYDNYYVINNEEVRSQTGTDRELQGFEKFDFALVGGIGYLFDNGFNINAGYDLGLYKVKEEEIEGSLYNRSIKLTLGYYF